MGYEEVSKAYRVYDVQARQVVISRDVNFDESTIGISTISSSNNEEEVGLEFDCLEISDDGVGSTDFRLAGKRKDRSSDADDKTTNSRQSYRATGLEEGSAPSTDSRRQVKRRPVMRMGPTLNEDEEEKDSHDDEDTDSSPPVFWHASANAVEAKDFSEPTTFQDAVSGPDQVHGAKPSKQNSSQCDSAVYFVLPSCLMGTMPLVPSGYSRSSAKRMAISKSTRRA
jgi:hypothetical protein